MPAKTIQPSPRALASQRNGALGGKARAAKYSKEVRDGWSAKGGTTTSEVYGIGLKQYASNLRKTVGRYKTPVELTVIAKKRKTAKG